MNRGFTSILMLAATLGAALPALAQAPRKDFIWARGTNGAAITLNGILNEPAWAQADSVVIRMAMDTGIPGSGYFYESGIAPVDPTYATVRFLTVGNQLYMGAYIRDHSIGGSNTFNRFDGLLMSIKDHATSTRPAPPTEYFYSWWYPEDSLAAIAPGAPIRFRGRWTGCNDTPSNCPRARTAQEIAAWDAVTTVGGTVNDDVTGGNDWGYVVEMRFDLGVMGYNITQSAGDVVEWNISIYDCDWNWPPTGQFSSNRVWWQNPWGNDFWYHNVRVMAKPSVTITSGAAPSLAPDIRIPAADNFAAPTINGTLTEPVWAGAPGIRLAWESLVPGTRNSYPGEGPWRSGEYQIYVNGYDGHDVSHPIPPILDPPHGIVKWFFKGDKLYLGFDVFDQIVQFYPYFPEPKTGRWDGFIVTLNDYSKRSLNNQQLWAYRYTFQVDSSAVLHPSAGYAKAQDELPALINAGGAQLALALKAPSPLDTLDRSASDVGYTAEMWIDLTKIGYPVGRGDGRIFIGLNLHDGDSFTNWPDSYSSTVWWQREHAGGSGGDGGSRDGPAWGYLDPTKQVLTVAVGDEPQAGRIELMGAQPNPFAARTSLYFTLPRPGAVTLQVFDMQGRKVVERDYGTKPAGSGHVIFDGVKLGSGLYLYRLRVAETAGGEPKELAGKMIVVR